MSRRRWVAVGVAWGVAACSGALVSAGLVQPSPDALAAKQGFEWSRHSAGVFEIYAEAGSPAALSVGRMADSLQIALDRVRRTLSLPDGPETIHVFFVRSSERMHSLLGHRVDGRSFYGTRLLALTGTGDWPATARHELTHVLLGNAWGGDADQWISEGTATWVGDHFYGRDVHRLARERLLETGKVLPVRELAGTFARHPDEVAYLQAASVAKFLVERFGIAALRAVWSGGTGALPAATGLDVDALDRAWRIHVGSAG